MSNVNRIASHPATHLVVLTAIVWLVFNRTLGTYFLADDFGEVSYASRIFNGEHNLLWANFTGNYMQIPGMAVWRPWLMISLFTDFCIWRGNAIGYFLTNLLSFNLVVALFYLLIYSLTQGKTDPKGKLVALLAAATFAVSPLHCESISWVVGRVDIVCAVFYLACLNFSLLAERAFTHGRTNTFRIATSLAVVSFWLGMWTKEMAIGAPVVVSVMILLFGHRPLDWKHALKLTTPLWLSIAVYFILRFLVLGTLLGGYVQGIGDSQAANALSHWLDPDTLRRLFFPLVYSIFGDRSWQQAALQFLYTVCFVLVLIRTFTLTVSVRWTCFLAVWALTCLAPLYKLWGMGYELEGARFCFFLSMPLSLLAPAMVIIGSSKRKLLRTTDVAIISIATTAIVFTVLILGKAAYLTNLVWVHAGQEVRQLAQQARLISSQSKAGERLLVLGIPKRNGGAHMVLNGATFVTALRPPFTNSDYSLPFITFDPIQFAECPYINSDRFKKYIAAGGKAIVWDSQSRKFKDIVYSSKKDLPQISIASVTSGYPHRLEGALSSRISTNQIAFNNILEGDAIAFSALNLNPLAADYLEARIRVLDNKPEPLKLGVSFDDKTRSYYESNTIAGTQKEENIRVPLSRNWKWFNGPTRDSLYLLLPPGRNIAISDCHFVRSEEVAPSVSTTSGLESNEGVIVIADSSSQRPNSIDLNVALPSLPSLSSIMVEISKANSFYENFPEMNGDAAIMTRLKFPLNAPIKIETSHFIPDCYHQIRVRLLDKDGGTVGELSCPITFQATGSKK